MESDDAGDDVLGQGLGTAQLGDLERSCWSIGLLASVPACWTHLGMGLDDLQPARPVWLLGVGPEEVPISWVVDLGFGGGGTVCAAVGAELAIGRLLPLGRAIRRCCHRASHGDGETAEI